MWRHAWGRCTLGHNRGKNGVHLGTFYAVHIRIVINIKRCERVALNRGKKFVLLSYLRP